jgi:hypothetical protein
LDCVNSLFTDSYADCISLSVRSSNKQIYRRKSRKVCSQSSPLPQIIAAYYQEDRSNSNSKPSLAQSQLARTFTHAPNPPKPLAQLYISSPREEKDTQNHRNAPKSVKKLFQSRIRPCDLALAVWSAKWTLLPLSHCSH